MVVSPFPEDKWFGPCLSNIGSSSVDLWKGWVETGVGCCYFLRCKKTNWEYLTQDFTKAYILNGLHFGSSGLNGLCNKNILSIFYMTFDNLKSCMWNTLYFY